MRSTRDDVEKLLGKSETQNPIVYYSIKEGSVQVEYSTGPCKPGVEVGWDVPEWAVVGVEYIPFESPLSVSSLKLDLAKLRKLPDTSLHYGESDSYVDDEAATGYWVRADGTVKRIIYSPPKQYDRLLCERKAR